MAAAPSGPLAVGVGDTSCPWGADMPADPPPMMCPPCRPGTPWKTPALQSAVEDGRAYASSVGTAAGTSANSCVRRNTGGSVADVLGGIGAISSSGSSSSNSSAATTTELAAALLRQRGISITWEIDLRNISGKNVDDLKLLNTIIFPVRYNDKFYQEVQTVGEFAKSAYRNDHMVGAICCRPEPIQDHFLGQGAYQLYIMTLGVLAPFRGLGIGTILARHIIAHARADRLCVQIYLHVQTSNDAALQFYQRLGFLQVQLIRNYYLRIEPPDAYLLALNLRDG